jgi:CrcB protein
MLLLGVAVAGSVGALARWFIDVATARAGKAPPFGTLLINVSGSFALGIVTGLALYHGLAPTTKVVLGTGFCGGYTTFSTFALQAVLLREIRGRAARYVISSAILPAAAAAIGLAITAI